MPSRARGQNTISVQLDENPAETAWTFTQYDNSSTRTSSGNTLYFQPHVSVGIPYTKLVKDFYLTPGVYELWFNDVGLDGFCCGQGEGYITVTSGDTILLYEWAIFRENYSFYFVVAKSSPTEVWVSFQHDEQPEETGWTLQDPTGVVVDSQATGSVTERYETVWKRVDLTTSGTYNFTITDTGGNGLSGGWGVGTVIVYAPYAPDLYYPLFNGMFMWRDAVESWFFGNLFY